MILHTYRITYYNATYPTPKVNDNNGFHKDGPYAGMSWSNIKAFTAEDALTQFNIEHSIESWSIKVCYIEALPDEN